MDKLMKKLHDRMEETEQELKDSQGAYVHQCSLWKYKEDERKLAKWKCKAM